MQHLSDYFDPRNSLPDNSISRLLGLLRGDGGMTTAEYAIGTVAAAAFAALLYTVITSDSVTAAITSLIERALEGSF